MNLNVTERLMLLNILPSEGDLTTLRIVRKTREALSFSEEEHASLKFRREPTGDGRTTVKWEPDQDVKKDVEIGPKAQAIVKEALRLLSAKKKLREEHLFLWDLFFEEAAAEKAVALAEA